MNRILAIAILTAAASSVVLGRARDQQDLKPRTKSGAVERELIRLDEEWNDAEERADVAMLDRIMAEEFISVSNRGVIETKTEIVAVFRSGDVKIESIVGDDYRVRVYGNIAIMTHRATLKGRYRNQDISDYYRTTHVWVKRSGRWQVVVSQITSIAEQ